LPEQSILIVHPDRKTQRIVQRILGVTGFRVDIADDLEQGVRLVQHQAPLLVVVDGSVAESPHADTFFTIAAPSRA
jgi:DNA-binding response OmpR family regulator